MSTLEELKKQASEVTQRNQLGDDGKAAEEQKWRKLGPVMKYLKAHFIELAETLNVLEKDILIDFEINSSVKVKRLKAQNYKVTHPNPDAKEKDFVFEFENSAANPSYALVPAGTAASAFKDTLTNNQIQHSITPVDGNKSIKFEIRPPIKTKYRFTVDLARENISITITNYNNIWVQTNYFTKNEITQELMDELTRHIMRDENKYNEMVGNVMSDEARTQLRQKLQKDITDKQAQAKAMEAKAAKQEPKKEKTLLGKFFKKK